MKNSEKNDLSSYRVFSLVFIFMCFAELLFKGGGQLVEQTDLLAVLQEASGSGRLVCQNKPATNITDTWREAVGVF